jgi:hypothetical protein
VKAATIGIRMLADSSVRLKDHKQPFWFRCWGQQCYISIFILIHLLYLKKLKNSLVPGEKYLEPTTSLHTIEAEGYEIHPDFISLVRELNFAGGLEEYLYMHLQDFEEICAILMISGMNHETLKWKALPLSLAGWAKQWYKLHVSNCHGSWVILKDQLCFTFFPLAKIIDLCNEVLNFAQKKVESSGAA